MKWEINQVFRGTNSWEKREDKLLAEGWEPYAATECQGIETIYFRCQLPEPKE